MITTLTAQQPGPPAFVPPPQAPSDDIWRVEHPGRNDPIEKDVAMELRRRFTEGESADSEFLQNSDTELLFLSGKHWIEEDTGMDKAAELRDRGRSAFCIDLLNPSIDLVVNQVRVNKLTANFIPLSEGADKATAEIRQGLYRNIERVSKAAIARETAYQLAVSVGRGYTRIVIEDEDGPSFLRRIAIKRVDNLRSILLDPTCLDFNCADAEWGIAWDDMWKGQYQEMYQKAEAEPLDISGVDLPEQQRAVWFPKDKVRVCEYFRRKWRRREVWKLEDGTECWKEDAPFGAQPVKIKSKLDYKIEWRMMTGSQTIEKRIWPGKFVPIVLFVGREVFRGRAPKINSGLVRPAMDPSRIHDYMESRKVDEVGLSPLPHFLAYAGQLTVEQKQIVNDINRHPWSVVEMTPVMDGMGRAVQGAGWVSPSPNTAAVVQATAGSKDNLERVLNTYAPQRGSQVGDQSGRAIERIKDAGDMSHAAFPDNFNRAITHEATIINDLMDSVYTDPQAITITELDDNTRRVLINQEYVDEKTGKKKIHIFGSSASYGVAITTGPSYQSRASEAAQKLLDLSKSFPQLSMALDLIIKDLGIPNAEKYAARVRPPQFQDDEDGPSLPQVQQHLIESQQQLQQADSLIEKLMAKVKELGDTNAAKRFETWAKMAIAADNNRTALMVQEAKAGQEGAHAVLMAKLERLNMALEQPIENQGLNASGQDNTPALGGQPAAPVPSPQQSVHVQAPDGSVHEFPHQQAADQFKAAIAGPQQ